jgi:hypothetical protein
LKTTPNVRLLCWEITLLKRRLGKLEKAVFPNSNTDTGRLITIVKETVADACEVLFLTLSAKTRLQKPSWARHVAMYLCALYDLGSNKHIAASFKRVPSMVPYSVRTVTDRIKQAGPSDAGCIDQVRKCLEILDKRPEFSGREKRQNIARPQ